MAFRFSLSHSLPQPKMSPFSLLSLLLSLLLPLLSSSLSVCRTACGNIQINYPFGIDDGCGAPAYRRMLNCSVSTITSIPAPTTSNTTVPISPTITNSPPPATATDLFFMTPSGDYKVQSVNYQEKTLTVYDPSMSTCSILQPHHDFVLSDIQSIIIPPSQDTVFALMNCSIDSPILNHYKSLCFNFSGHSCDELYGACTSFKLFNLLSNDTPPACCFTGYDTVRYMSMNILDCTHYTTVYNVDGLKGIRPVDWLYGIKLVYSAPDTGCDRCQKSGGTCGFDVETEGMLCICSNTINSTRECAPGTATGPIGEGRGLFPFIPLVFSILGANFIVIL